MNVCLSTFQRQFCYSAEKRVDESQLNTDCLKLETEEESKTGMLPNQTSVFIVRFPKFVKFLR